MWEDYLLEHGNVKLVETRTSITHICGATVQVTCFMVWVPVTSELEAVLPS